MDNTYMRVRGTPLFDNYVRYASLLTSSTTHTHTQQQHLAALHHACVPFHHVCYQSIAREHVYTIMGDCPSMCIELTMLPMMMVTNVPWAACVTQVGCWMVPHPQTPWTHTRQFLTYDGWMDVCASNVFLICAACCKSENAVSRDLDRLTFFVNDGPPSR